MGISETMEDFHNKCIKLIENKAKELNYDLEFKRLFFYVNYGFLGFKIAKLRYEKVRNIGHSVSYGILKIERKCEWWAYCDYTYEYIGVATKENIKLVCKYGETFLNEIPGAVESTILKKQKERKESESKRKQLEEYCDEKIKKIIYGG